MRYNPDMRRLARLTLNSLTVLSLLLCVGTVVLWARSYGPEDAVERKFEWAVQTGGHTDLHWTIGLLVSDKGRVVAEHWRCRWEDFEGNMHLGLRWTYHPDSLGYGIVTASHGFGLFASRDQGRDDIRRMDYDIRAVGVPHWLATVLLSALPLARGVRTVRRAVHRRRAIRAGFCAICGYDLRATPDHCPECGAVTKGVAT